MKNILLLIVFMASTAFAQNEVILPEDLAENEVLQVAEYKVDWKSGIQEYKTTSKCDGIIWDRLLVVLPADIPFEISYQTVEAIDYETHSVMQPGEEIHQDFIWKQDEVNGLKRLLFRNQNQIYYIFRTKEAKPREFRIAVAGPC